jgi:hypothetical protein
MLGRRRSAARRETLAQFFDVVGHLQHFAVLINGE